MAANMSDLVPDFRRKAEQLLKRCRQRGVEMRPYFTLRTPFEQAKLWRQSRSIEEIREKVAEFRDGGANFLAYCLESVGPQHGAHVTNAPPGFSWHQWREAVDCFWVVDRKTEWSTIKRVDGLNGYRVYAEEAANLGLSAGGLWTSFKDWPHVQFRSASNPGKIFGLNEIDEKMKKLFGN